MIAKGTRKKPGSMTFMPNYRILYLSSQFPIHTDPQIGVFSVERVKAMARAGCEVVVIAPTLINPPRTNLIQPAQLVRWCIQQALLPRRSNIEGI